MAKRVSLPQAFADPDEDTAATADVATSDETSVTAKKAPAATKKSSSKKGGSGRQQGSGTKKAASGRATAKKAADATATDNESGGRTPRAQIRVKGASTKEAEKFLLYVHPDYWRALEFAKVEDRVDRQARIRAMIALWNEDPIFKAAVDRIARTAPRGEH